MSFKPIDTSAEQGDLGLAIQMLIQRNLQNFNTCFLAQIVGINGNKVSVTQMIKSNGAEADLIVNDCLIAYPFSNVWQVQFALKNGDIGICIVLNKDISAYKQSGERCNAPTSRYKDINDSVFIPLSLFKTLPNDSVDFTIKGESDELTFNKGELLINASKKCDFKAQNEFKLESQQSTIESPAIMLNGNVTIGGNLAMGSTSGGGAGGISSGGEALSAGNDSGTLGDCFEAIFSALDLIASGMTGGSTNPSAYNGGKSALKEKIKGIVK